MRPPRGRAGVSDPSVHRAILLRCAVGRVRGGSRRSRVLARLTLFGAKRAFGSADRKELAVRAACALDRSSCRTVSEPERESRRRGRFAEHLGNRLVDLVERAGLLSTRGAALDVQSEAVPPSSGLMLGLVHKPEEGSCPSCRSIVLADVDHRRSCLDFPLVAHRVTRAGAIRLIHRRWRRSLPSGSPPPDCGPGEARSVQPSVSTPVISTNIPAGSVYEQVTTLAWLSTTLGAARRIH